MLAQVQLVQVGSSALLRVWKPAPSEEAGRRELVAASDRQPSQSLHASAAARVAMTLRCGLSPDRLAPDWEARGGRVGPDQQARTLMCQAQRAREESWDLLLLLPTSRDGGHTPDSYQ